MDNQDQNILSRLKNSRLIRVIQWLWVCLIIFVLIWYVNKHWSQFTDYNWHVRPVWLVAAAVAAALRKLLGGLRWVMIARYPETSASPREALGHLKTYFLSNMALYIPGNVWFIAGRLYMSKNQGVSVFKSSLGIGYEIVLNVWSGLLVGSFVGIGFLVKDKLTLAIIFCLFFGLSLVLFSGKAVNLLLGIVQRLSKRPVVPVSIPFFWMTRVVFLSLASWLLLGMSLVCIINSLHAQAGADAVYVVSCLALAWVIGFCTPWAPAGMGIQEGLIIWFLRQYPAPVPFIAALGMRLLYVFEDVFWALATIAASKITGFYEKPKDRG